MAPEERLCRQCGGPMGLAPDGRRYVCRRAPDRHPAVRVAGARTLQGGWGWAGLAAGVLMPLAALAWFLGLRGSVQLREPLVVALGLALTGFAFGYGPTFAYRMFRPQPAVWNGPGTLLAVGLLSGGGFALVALLAMRVNPDARLWPLAVAAVAWAAGLAAAYLPYAVAAEPAGSRLARALKAQRGRTAQANAACAAPGCANLGIPCGSERCRRTLCGTHWIQAEGRCNGCGFSFQRPAAPARRFNLSRLVQLAAMAASWLAITSGGYLLVRPH